MIRNTFAVALVAALLLPALSYGQTNDPIDDAAYLWGKTRIQKYGCKSTDLKCVAQAMREADSVAEFLRELKREGVKVDLRPFLKQYGTEGK